MVVDSAPKRALVPKLPVNKTSDIDKKTKWWFQEDKSVEKDVFDLLDKNCKFEHVDSDQIVSHKSIDAKNRDQSILDDQPLNNQELEKGAKVLSGEHDMVYNKVNVKLKLYNEEEENVFVFSKNLCVRQYEHSKYEKYLSVSSPSGIMKIVRIQCNVDRKFHVTKAFHLNLKTKEKQCLIEKTVCWDCLGNKILSVGASAQNDSLCIITTHQPSFIQRSVYRLTLLRFKAKQTISRAILPSFSYQDRWEHVANQYDHLRTCFSTCGKVIFFAAALKGASRDIHTFHYDIQRNEFSLEIVLDIVADDATYTNARLLSTRLNNQENVILSCGRGTLVKYTYTPPNPDTQGAENGSINIIHKFTMSSYGDHVDFKICQKTKHLFVLTVFNKMVIMDALSVQILFLIDFTFQDLGTCKSLTLSLTGDEVVLITNNYYKTYWVPIPLQEMTLTKLAMRILTKQYEAEEIKKWSIPKSLKHMLLVDRMKF